MNSAPEHSIMQDNQVILVSADAELARLTGNALAASDRIGLQTVSDLFSVAAGSLDLNNARVIVADIRVDDNIDLEVLDAFMEALEGRIPVIAITDRFDDRVARRLIQLRVADFLCKPVNAEELLRSCIKAIRESAASESTSETKSRILSFLPAMGGVGVTTLAIETAHQLVARDGCGSTVLVDLDFQQGACADHLDIEPQLDVEEIIARIDRLDHQLLEIMHARHASGIVVLAAPNRPTRFDAMDTHVLTRFLDLVSSHFANVVLDLPRHWRPWTDVVLAGSDDVFIVTDMTVPGLRAARRITDTIHERLRDQVPARVIVNRFEQSMFPWAGLRRTDAEKSLGNHLAGMVSNNYRLVREAIDRGVLLSEIKPNSNIASDVEKILFGQAEEKKAGLIPRLSRRAAL